MNTVEKQSSRNMLYFAATIIAIFFMIIISLYYLFFALQASLEGSYTEAVYYGLFGIIGIGIAAYMSFMIGRRRFFRKPQSQIVTVVECKKCNYKSIDKFKKDDYVFKNAGNCPKCNEPMLITAIYNEEIKKK